MVNKHNMIAEQLYYIVNQKVGFNFDYKVCNVPDFYQFLIHYCHQSINLQFINGVFVAFTKNMNFMSCYLNTPNYQSYNNYAYFNHNVPVGHYGNFSDTNGNCNVPTYGYHNQVLNSTQQYYGCQTNSSISNQNGMISLNQSNKNTISGYNYSCFNKNQGGHKFQEDKGNLKTQKVSQNTNHYHHQAKDS